MPMFSSAAVNSLLSTNSSSGTSPESNRNDVANQHRMLTRQAVDALALLHQSQNQPGNSHLTIEERDQFVQENIGADADNDDEDAIHNSGDDDDDDDDDGGGEDNGDEEGDDEGNEGDDNANGDAVASIFRAHIVDNTRKGYQRAQKKFVVWIFNQTIGQSQRATERQRFRSMLDQGLFTALSTENRRPAPKLEEVALPFIQQSCETYHPIKLQLLRAQDFVAYLLSMAPDGEFKSKSTYGGARAALFNLFITCKIKQSQQFEDDLKQAYGGLKRKAQAYKAQSGARLSEGKKPLPFALYKMLCGWLVAEGSKESIFAWSFLTLTWNLICRSKNTVNVHKSHMSWENDSLTIQFAHSKTDMTGSQESYKRHIYGNPQNPVICPILALTCYLATTPTRGAPGKLFNGTSQYERFRKQLQSLVDEHSEEIRGMGIDPQDLGVHSIRKGAATYVCSGTTCAPSIAAVCNRAGWTMGRVKDTYIRYESAMDEYVGRMVCGLDINSSKFSVSPPHFLPQSVESRVGADLSGVFPFPITTEHRLLLKFCYATMVYAKSFLLNKLGVLSPMRSNVLLRNSNALQIDTAWVDIRFAHEEHDIHLTGIPPHVIYLVQLEKVLEKMQLLYDQSQLSLLSVSERIISEIKADLDDRSIGGGEVSMNRLTALLQPIRDELIRVNQRMDSSTDGTREQRGTTESGTETSTPARWLTHEWGGRWRRLPFGWKFNREMTVLCAWQCWHHGDETTPPLKLLDHWDLSDNHMVRGKSRPIREAEVRYLNFMSFLCRELDSAANVTGRPSLGDIVQYYNSAAVQAILPTTNTQASRVRRADELNWRHAVDVMKEQKRRRTQQNEEDGAQ
jgi:hypothetical protein